MGRGRVRLQPLSVCDRLEARRLLSATATGTPVAAADTSDTAAAVPPPVLLATYKVFGAEERSTDSTPLLTFRDSVRAGVSGSALSVFKVGIDWGDGQTSSGSVAPIAGGPSDTFEAWGSHVYADEGAYTIRVTVNDGFGTLAAQTTARVADAVVTQKAQPYPAPTGQAVLGDFNGDGLSDLVTGGSGSNQLAALLGAGDGKFGPTQTVASVNGAGVRAVAAADFNGDGRSDIAAATADATGAAGHVEVYFGNADGTFTRGDDLTVGAAFLRAADFNGDGRIDVLAAGATLGGQMVLALGDGGGRFVASPLPQSDGASSVAVADLNGDGRPDVASCVPGSTDVLVRIGRGDGTFDPAVTYRDAAAAGASGGGQVAAGDFDGDGDADLAVADPTVNSLSYLANAGDGTFAVAHYLLDQSYAAGRPVGATAPLLAADLNGDGVADLLRSNVVRLGQGQGTYQPFQRNLSLPTYLYPQSSSLTADLNTDGRTDVVLVGQSAPTGGRSEVDVLLNTPYVLTLKPSATEGVELKNVVVGTVQHEDTPTSPDGLSATVDWRDGNVGPATLVPNAAGGLDVIGSHPAYLDTSEHNVRVVVTEPHGLTSDSTVTFRVEPAPIAVTPRTIRAVAGAPFTSVIATFTNGNPRARDFSNRFDTKVEWGDGTVAAGKIRDDKDTGPGYYQIVATHAYSVAGSFPVRVTVTDSFLVTGAPRMTGTASSTAEVSAPAVGTGTISGAVVVDLNFNGRRDDPDYGAPFVSVYIDANTNGSPDPGEPQVLTSSEGAYTFADVPAGTWSVRQVISEATSRQTFPADGTPLTVTLAAGQQASGVDFGRKTLPAVYIDVGSDFRRTPVTTATIYFSEPVTGLTPEYFALGDDVIRPLSSARQTLTTADGGSTWTLGNLPPYSVGPWTLELSEPVVSAVTGQKFGWFTYAWWYVDDVPPTVKFTDLGFFPGPGQSLELGLSEDLANSLDVSDLSLVNVTTGERIPTAAMHLVTFTTDFYGVDTSEYLTFPGLPNTRLPDGDYVLTVSAAGVFDRSGNVLDGNGDGRPGDDAVFLVHSTGGYGSRLSWTATPGSAYSITGPANGQVLSVTSGTVTVRYDLSTLYPNIRVAASDGARIVFNADQHLAGLTLTGGATATLASVAANRSVSIHRILVVGSLNIDAASGSRLDLADNDLVVHNGSLPAVQSLLRSGYGDGTWNGSGITSSVAALPANRLTFGLGYLLNGGNPGQPVPTARKSTFGPGRESVTATDVLVKYTFRGDANLDGSVDPQDYFYIDASFPKASGSTWALGDYDYNDSVDPSDLFYTDSNVGRAGL